MKSSSVSVAQPGMPQTARVIALRAGIPESVPADDGFSALRIGAKRLRLQERLLAGAAQFLSSAEREHVEHSVFIQATHRRKIQPAQRAKGLGQRLQPGRISAVRFVAAHRSDARPYRSRLRDEIWEKRRSACA